MPNLNDKLIKSLPIPKTKYKIYWDDRLTGLGIRITNNNAKSFVLRYVINGRERKYTIGGHPELSTTAAREMANQLKGDIARGHDPLQIKQRNYDIPTFKTLAEEYIKLSEKSKRPKTVEEYKSMLKKYLIPKFGNLKINSINKKDVTNLHLSLKETPYRANRILQLLSSIFNCAINWEWINNNPIKGVKKFSEDRRERYLSDEEMKKLLEALNQTSNPNATIIKLILLTGSRKSEVLSARWQDFDLENNIWIKPASLTKQNKTSYVPINSETLEIIKKLKETIISTNKIENSKENKIISTTEYLFYNLQTKTHLKDIKKFWKNICQKSGIKNARIHDLRHTFASTLVSDGVSLEIIGKLLGHSNTSTTQRYSHLANHALKQATEIFSKKIRS